MNYYNEFDKQAAAWLRELIKRGMIPQGEVDERSIEDVKPGDLRDYRQCHFFAGIGGWAYALELAGWPADKPVWTGSCPCQPFSSAGKGAGFYDQRHLWPAWLHLIRECRPAAVFGEQVASAAVGPWLDLVHADLEGMDYAFGSVAFPAAGVGAPHIRDRTYWVAYASGEGLQECQRIAAVPGGAVGTDAREAVKRRSVRTAVGLGNAVGAASERVARSILGAKTAVDPARVIHGCVAVGLEHAGAGMGASGAGPVNGHWRAADWLGCRDGRWRPVEPGTFPLAHGLPARVGRLRGYGNAIVPQAATEFIVAAEESRLMQVAA